MTEELPAPLVPPEVNLRGYGFMPLFCDRLFASETWIGASAEGKVAALVLWWHAYAKEVPSASLPDDNKLLANYAGYGVAIKAWAKVRAEVMRGWVKCSDGRLYHPFVASIANEAWQGRKALRDRTEKARQTRLLQRQSQNKSASVTSSVTESRGRGTGTEKQSSSDLDPSSSGAAGTKAPPPAHDKPSKSEAKPEVIEGPAYDLAMHMQGIEVDIKPDDPRLEAWISKGMTLGIAEDAVERARTRKGRAAGPIPANLVALIIDDLLTGKADADADSGRKDPRCTGTVNGERCPNHATNYPGHSKKGLCGSCREEGQIAA